MLTANLAVKIQNQFISQPGLHKQFVENSTTAISVSFPIEEQCTVDPLSQIKMFVC